uniref:Rho-GAP domain-containing protein n=1 Tax=Parastrongyloides trichosuri TaxID=131310 RepID=A0A0N4ZIV5_PARTI
MPISKYRMVFCGYQGVHARFKDRLEKVKFGVPMSNAFQNGDIPGPLLVLLLKVNKEGPLRKDIWRAPGNQAQVKKIAHIMRGGRMMNISDINVYTAASIVKRFLSKLPGGVFGPENERLLFGILHESDPVKQRAVFAKIIRAMDQVSQNFMVLLFGTFRIIADSSITFDTRMNPEAIGISVAPSLFHTCINDTKAKFDDVRKFKQASHIIAIIIDNFGFSDMFSRESYEYYAKITGRTLRVEENWMFSFQYPIKNGRRQNLGTSLGALNMSQSEVEASADHIVIPIAKRSTSASIVLSRSAIGAASITGCVDPHHQPCCSCASAEKPLSLIFGKSYPPEEIPESHSIGIKSQSYSGPLKPHNNHHSEYRAYSYPTMLENGEVEEDYEEEIKSHINGLCYVGSSISVPSKVYSSINNYNNKTGDMSSQPNIDLIQCTCAPTTLKNLSDCTCSSKYNNYENNKELLSSRISSSLNEGIAMPNYLCGYDLIVKHDDASENSRSLYNLEWVHSKQKERMKNRSEWFLSGTPNLKNKIVEKVFEKNETNEETFIKNCEKNEEKMVNAANDIVKEGNKTLKEETITDPVCKEKIPLSKTLSDKPILLPSTCNPASNIVRRSSWKKHYFRAQKSLDSSIETHNNEELISNGEHKPIRRISTLTGLTRPSTEDENQSKRGKTLVRRKSSSSMKYKSSNYYPTSTLLLSNN